MSLDLCAGERGRWPGSAHDHWPVHLAAGGRCRPAGLGVVLPSMKGSRWLLCWRTCYAKGGSDYGVAVIDSSQGKRHRGRELLELGRDLIGIWLGFRIS